MNMTDTETPTAVPPPQPQVQPQLTMDEPQGMDLSDSSVPGAFIFASVRRQPRSHRAASSARPAALRA